MNLGPLVTVAWDEEELTLEARLFLDEAGEPHRWNGWVCPAFDRTNAQKLIDYNNKAYADAPDGGISDTFEWDGDTLIWTDHDYPESEPDRIEPYWADDGPRWDIGSYGWTWYVVEPREGSDEYADDREMKDYAE